MTAAAECLGLLVLGLTTTTHSPTYERLISAAHSAQLAVTSLNSVIHTSDVNVVKLELGASHASQCRSDEALLSTTVQIQRSKRYVRSEASRAAATFGFIRGQLLCETDRLAAGAEARRRNGQFYCFFYIFLFRLHTVNKVS